MSLQFQNYRAEDIRRNLRRMGARPLDVVAVGVTGAGKSTTLNAFFQKTVAKEGDGVDPETMEVGDYSLNDFFRIWDTPGLGDSPAQDRKHRQEIISLLHKTYSQRGIRYGWIDMALVILDGSSRDMGTAYKLISDILIPNIQKERILVLINQADIAIRGGGHWDYYNNTPDSALKSFLDDKAVSVQRRVQESVGISIIRPVYYSAKYGYNVKGVFDFIINHMPSERRNVF